MYSFSPTAPHFRPVMLDSGPLTSASWNTNNHIIGHVFLLKAPQQTKKGDKGGLTIEECPRGHSPRDILIRHPMFFWLCFRCEGFGLVAMLTFARQGKAREGKAKEGKARHGKPNEAQRRQGKAWNARQPSENQQARVMPQIEEWLRNGVPCFIVRNWVFDKSKQRFTTLYNDRPQGPRK